MAKPMSNVEVPLECGHAKEMEQWDRGDRHIQCDTCSRLWVVTVSREYAPVYQTKTELKPHNVFQG